jgi:hypothetical protein
MFKNKGPETKFGFRAFLLGKLNAGLSEYLIPDECIQCFPAV